MLRVVVEGFGGHCQAGYLCAVEQDLHVLQHMARGIAVEIVERDLDRDHAIYCR